tara:strand:+ start:1447 stop:1551 length:105 start_codon:yes stop_codon:yes gene_type:complete
MDVRQVPGSIIEYSDEDKEVPAKLSLTELQMISD